ncbi:MAG: zinc ribbon domain-containing protein [Nitrososphaeria archaeon]|jgi:TM2 domain-containing membrane protein YozV
MVSCPKCGREAPKDAILCPYCGERMSMAPAEFSPLTLAAMSKLRELKNPGFAALISAIFGLVGIWGFGHFYVGKVLRGIIWLIVGLLLIMSLAYMSYSLGLLTAFRLIYPPFSNMTSSAGFGSIAIVAVLIALEIIGFYWQIFDAYSSAKNFNTYYQENNEAPW